MLWCCCSVDVDVDGDVVDIISIVFISRVQFLDLKKTYLKLETRMHLELLSSVFASPCTRGV